MNISVGNHYAVDTFIGYFSISVKKVLIPILQIQKVRLQKVK